MKLSYTNCKTITLSQIEPINELQGENEVWLKDAMIEDIDKIVIGVRYNCCDNTYLETEIDCQESESDTSFYVIIDLRNSDCEYESDFIVIDTDLQTITLTKEFFTALNPSSPDHLLDGVYTITISIYYADGSFYEEENCIFVDCQTACKLAAYMAQNLGSAKATELAMIHFALTEAANCECVCDDLCTLFEYLWNSLNGIQITSNCGC